MKTTVICILLSPCLLIAQQNSGAWTNIGPSPAAIEAIAVDPQGTRTIFMGTTNIFPIGASFRSEFPVLDREERNR